MSAYSTMLHLWLGAIAAAILLGPAGAQAGERPAPDELRNTTYTGIYPHPITLSQGVYEGEPLVPDAAARPRLGLIEGMLAYTDLDGDGNEEALVLLWESSGGTGTFSYMAVVARQDGEVRNVATRRIGDRVQIRSMEAKEAMVVLDLVVAGPNDPACCPTTKVRHTYRLEDGQLQVTTEEQGELTLADLEAITWRLTHLDQGEPLPAGVEATATFADAKVAGMGGCNRYFGNVKAASPYDLSIGPVGGTRMACPSPQMEVEDRYLGALDNATQFGFLNGRLALTYEKPDGVGTLLFEPTTE